jgi:hypothetical protein
MTRRMSKVTWLGAPLSAVAIGALLLALGGGVAAKAPHGLHCQGEAATISSSKSSDHIRGTNHADVISAQSGSDTVRGRGGADLICGDQDNDHLFGGRGKDEIWGDTGFDRCRGGADHDNLYCEHSIQR